MTMSNKAKKAATKTHADIRKYGIAGAKKQKKDSDDSGALAVTGSNLEKDLDPSYCIKKQCQNWMAYNTEEHMSNYLATGLFGWNKAVDIG